MWGSCGGEWHAHVARVGVSGTLTTIGQMPLQGWHAPRSEWPFIVVIRLVSVLGASMWGCPG